MIPSLETPGPEEEDEPPKPSIAEMRTDKHTRETKYAGRALSLSLSLSLSLPVPVN